MDVSAVDDEDCVEDIVNYGDCLDVFCNYVDGAEIQMRLITWLVATHLYIQFLISDLQESKHFLDSIDR